ncbi:GPI mannosyltransferase 2 [Polychytrium aggregatum]|uniref:GPI mannosyltransferase 2 n=1 Tax=Polychytrium aggregatum TaxID=110093 RepID=UPI0022FE321C|nr:GPI mannosyltransferase 2 [Polychytrium aggregatum]KAI9193744.1 GPI mannosyltransferase 2 [Polychytrium aggregatum]
MSPSDRYAETAKGTVLATPASAAAAEPSSRPSLLGRVLLIRLVVLLIALLAPAVVPPYDTSALYLVHGARGAWDSWVRARLVPLASWDAIHFIRIAEYGYIYEKDFAFLPGYPLLMNAGALLLRPIFSGLMSWKTLLMVSGVLVSNLSFVCAAMVLFALTRQLMPGNVSLAYAATLCFAFLPCSIIMSSIYSESSFCLFTFTGMLLLSRRQYLRAALVWSFAGLIRSNGILYAGFFIYELILRRRPKRLLSRAFNVAQAIFYTGIVWSGFALYQLYGFQLFCAPDAPSRPWCTRTVPLIYSFVQEKYWNNGFLRYYEPGQIGNFTMAMPVAILSAVAIYQYLSADSRRLWSLGYSSITSAASVTGTSSASNAPSSTKNRAGAPLESYDSIFPHIVLWLVMLVYCMTMMHVQVIIRFLSCMPGVFWYVAEWNRTRLMLGKVYVCYFVSFALAGAVLFSAFYPPA